MEVILNEKITTYLFNNTWFILNYIWVYECFWQVENV